MIDEQIRYNHISEAAAYTKRLEVIRDIYARAIPGLVYLLSSSFTFHRLHPYGLRRFKALREIVRIQEIILLLCVKAKSWKAKPNTNNPIIKPTKTTIFPYLLLKALAIPPLATSAPRTSTRTKRQNSVELQPSSFFSLPAVIHIFTYIHHTTCIFLLYFLHLLALTMTPKQDLSICFAKSIEDI